MSAPTGCGALVATAAQNWRRRPNPASCMGTATLVPLGDVLKRDRDDHEQPETLAGRRQRGPDRKALRKAVHEEHERRRAPTSADPGPLRAPTVRRRCRASAMRVAEEKATPDRQPTDLGAPPALRRAAAAGRRPTPPSSPRRRGRAAPARAVERSPRQDRDRAKPGRERGGRRGEEEHEDFWHPLSVKARRRVQTGNLLITKSGARQLAQTGVVLPFGFRMPLPAVLRAERLFSKCDPNGPPVPNLCPNAHHTTLRALSGGHAMRT